MLDQFGRGIKGAVITLTSPDGSQRTAVTGANGIYVFDSVPLGEAYGVRANHKRYSFTPESIEYVHVGKNSEQNFTANNR